MKVLIVDGYNVMNKIGYLSDISDESLKDARDAVSKLAKEYKRRDGGISEVYVVFDGKNQYRDVAIPRPKEHIFSDTGKGDQKIVELIRKFSDKHTIIVVSDDNYVRNSARAHCASLLRPSQLLTRNYRKTRY
ncbi:MAG: NYN domain-containing protein [Candidatus Omnitrophota bacterium]|nr:NYN domain-containing protein [Candidatus Omnitrophota bacterium]